jgi:hypothetical protein
MKKKKVTSFIKQMIEIPLRFHHSDIHSRLDVLEEIHQDVHKLDKKITELLNRLGE